MYFLLEIPKSAYKNVRQIIKNDFLYLVSFLYGMTIKKPIETVTIIKNRSFKLKSVIPTFEKSFDHIRKHQSCKV